MGKPGKMEKCWRSDRVPKDNRRNASLEVEAPGIEFGPSFYRDLGGQCHGSPTVKTSRFCAIAAAMTMEVAARESTAAYTDASRRRARPSRTSPSPDTAASTTL
jgi:hypothetical protein